jgi:predicted nuclease with TOPRIM domain
MYWFLSSARGEVVTETPGRYTQDNIDQQLELLIQQTGLLTEAVTGLRLASEDQRQSIELLAETTRLHGERLNLIDTRLDRLTAITERQSERLDELTAITSTQNDRLDRIEERLDLLLGVAERQATAAERQGDRLEQLARTAAEQRQSIELLAQTMQLFVETRG